MRWYKTVKSKIDSNHSIVLFLIGTAIVVFSVSSLFLHKDEGGRKTTLQNQPTPTPTPTAKETEAPPDTSGWLLYDKYGLKFRYPPNWRVSIPGETFTFGNHRIWRIDDISGDDSPLIYLLIHRIRRYTPLPGFNDILTGYLVEQMGQEDMEFSQKRDDWRGITFKGRKATRITVTDPWSGHPRDSVFVSIPKESGILSISFSWSQPSFDQAIKDYFEPFLESLEIGLGSWPEPGTYFSLTTSSQLDASSWKVYQGENFSLKYPESWWVKEEEIEYEPTTIVLSKLGGEPQIFIGRSTIFSTSGAICANEPYCKEIGEAEIRTKDNNYFATIFEKKLTFSDEKNSYRGDPSYYVFAVNLNRLPSEPTITALYKTVAEGQEIVDILSTISY